MRGQEAASRRLRWIMNGRSRPRRRSRRNPETIAFLGEPRAERDSNEFADAVWQMVGHRRCGKQKFRREYPISALTRPTAAVLH